MVNKRSISVRISSQRVAALAEICDEMLEEFVPCNEHQVLLYEYLYELKQQLSEMLKRGQDLYTLKMAGSQSIAFCQLWAMLDISRDKYAHLVVENLLGKMSSLAA